MANGEPRRIKIVIYPNQLEWIDRIGKIMHRTRRQVFLECFSEYIGAFKSDTGLNRQEEENGR
jgi:hypothetical protein